MQIFECQKRITMNLSSVWYFLIFVIIIAAHGLELYNGVTTDRQYYYIGESVTIHCHPNQTASTVTFFYNQDISVPKEYITVVNASYAFVKLMLNESYPAEIVFHCKNGNEFVGSKEICLEYPPQNVTSLTYEYYDQEDFNASWNLGINYRFPVDTVSTQTQQSVTIISAEYASSADKGNWQMCNLTTATTCIIYELHKWTEVSLRVTVTNVRRNDSVVTLFENLVLDAYVKPAPVEIKSLILNSTCASVSWISKKFYPKYDISGNVMNMKTPRSKFTRCELHPFYNYTVTVKVLPREGFPSEERSIVLHMPQDAPSSGPGLMDGGYYRKSCLLGNETIYIFFTPLKMEHRNGVIMNYTAILTAETWSYKYFVSNAEANTFVVYVPCRKGFVVNMSAATVVGYSPETTLLIPDADKVTDLHTAVQKLDLHIEEDGNEGVKTALWTWKPEFPVNQLALYYCESKTSFTRVCKEEMPMEKIDVNPTDQKKTFTAKGANLFGLAAATADGKWTSVVFTDCIYLTDQSHSSSLQVPDPPKVVQDTGLIKLSWHQEKCDASSRRLTYHCRVKWCSPLTCRYDNVSIEDASLYTLSDVEIGLKYRISIAALTSRGSTDYSKPVMVTVKPLPRSGFVSQNIELISSVVSVMVAVTMVLILCLCRKSWKVARQKFSNKLLLPVPGTDPSTGNKSSRREVCEVMQVPHWTALDKCRQFLNNSNCKQREDNKKVLNDEQNGGCETGSEYEISYTELLDLKYVIRPAGYTFLSLDSFELSCDQLQKSDCLRPSVLCLDAGNLLAPTTAGVARKEHSLLGDCHSNQTVSHFPAVNEDFIGLEEEGLKSQNGRKTLSESQNSSDEQIIIPAATEDTRPGDRHASTCIASGYVLPNFLLESGPPGTGSLVEFTGRRSLCNTQNRRREEDTDAANQHQINRVNRSPCRNPAPNTYMNIKDPSVDSYVQATASSCIQEDPCYNHHEEPCGNMTQGCYCSFQSHFESLGLTFPSSLLTEGERTNTELKARGLEMTVAEPQPEVVMTQQKDVCLNTSQTETDDGEMGRERENNSEEIECDPQEMQDEQKRQI